MKQEHKRIALAVASGWASKLVRQEDAFFDRAMIRITPPDYFNDLNAVHKAEKLLLTSSKLEERYYIAIDRDPFATAEKRAEQLGRVLNFWNE